jgi:hypothetical protein
VAPEVQRLERRELAANIHFIGSPQFTITGRTAEVSFTIAGIGNQPVDMEFTVSGTADVVINNPGGNDPPGQQVPFVLSTSDFTQTTDKNGNVTFTGSVTVTDADILEDVQLKRNWTAEVTSFEFTDVSLTVRQGNTVLTA